MKHAVLCLALLGASGCSPLPDTDGDGIPGSSDISVEGPDGQATSQPDPPAKDPRLDNNVVERVVIAAASAGTYRIQVSAARLRSAPQPFALVASRARVLE